MLIYSNRYKFTNFVIIFNEFKYYMLLLVQVDGVDRRGSFLLARISNRQFYYNAQLRLVFFNTRVTNTFLGQVNNSNTPVLKLIHSAQLLVSLHCQYGPGGRLVANSFEVDQCVYNFKIYYRWFRESTVLVNTAVTVAFFKHSVLRFKHEHNSVAHHQHGYNK